MSDDLLGDILRASQGPKQPETRAQASFDALLGQVVAGARRSPSAPKPVRSIDELLRLDAQGWAVFMRYLPSDLLPPLLGGAGIAVANRLVNALDEEGREWLRAQSDAIEEVPAETHRQAVAKALAILDRLVEERKIAVADAPVERVAFPADERTAPPPPPVTVGVTFDTPVQSAEAPVPTTVGAGFRTDQSAEAPPPMASGARIRDDAVVDVVAALVAAAKGKPAEYLRVLAEEVDHPVLVAGLRALAAGADAHGVTSAVGEAEEDWLADQRRRIAVMLEGLLAIRFEEGEAAFRHRLALRARDGG